MSVRRFASGRIALCVWFSLGSAMSTCPAEIGWVETCKDFGKITDPAISELHNTFEFKNTGTNSIKISQIDRTCGCTSATLEDMVDYAAGASGKIFVSFEIGARHGVQRKKLTVHFKDSLGTESSEVVEFTADIAPVFALSEDYIIWHGKDLSPRTVGLKFLSGQHAKVVKIISSDGDDSFTSSISESVPDQAYSITFAPRRADDELRVNALILTDSALARLKRIPVSLIKY